MKQAHIRVAPGVTDGMKASTIDACAHKRSVPRGARGSEYLLLMVSCRGLQTLGVNVIPGLLEACDGYVVG